jgi:hypothetical protein
MVKYRIKKVSPFLSCVMHLNAIKQRQSGWKYDRIPLVPFISFIKIYFENIKNKSILKVGEKYPYL